MTAEIKEGQVVYTADGEKVGAIKEVVESSGLTYFRIGMTFRRDFWIAGQWADRNEDQEGEKRLILEFPKDLLDNYKLPQPA